MIGGVALGLAIASPAHYEKGAGVAASGALAVAAATIGTAIGAIAALTRTEIWESFDPATVPLQPSSTPR